MDKVNDIIVGKCLFLEHCELKNYQGEQSLADEYQIKSQRYKKK